MARKKPEGIEALVSKEEPISIQEITLMDWFAAFALMSVGPDVHSATAASRAFDRAEEMMKERVKR
jgi:hypothetical protein